MPILLLGGFVIDWFTLNRIDQIFDNMVFVVHLFLSGSAILFLHATDEHYLQDHPARHKFRRWASLVLLFSIGALYSGFFIFYLRSASFLSSWVVVLALLGIMLSTEWRKSLYEHRAIQMGIYYLAILCYCIFTFPMIVNDVGAMVFVLSGLISLVLMGGYWYLMRRIDRDLLREYRAGILAGILGVFMVTNFLYFMNIIPPIPLSLKQRSPYMYIEKRATDEGATYYHAVYEKTPWYDIIHKRSRVLSWQEGQPVFVFASVFAPSNIVAEIRHCWDWFDPDAESWQPSTCIPITIAGGRVDGYRGFSRKSSVWPGRWRVRFVTDRGQPMGAVYFKVVERRIDPGDVRSEVL